MSTFMTLGDRILQIDHIQARRFNKLTGDAKRIAEEGIVRHLRACARNGNNADANAIREIIEDALQGRRVWAEANNDQLFFDRNLKSNEGYKLTSRNVVDPLDKIKSHEQQETQTDGEKLKNMSLNK